MNPNAAAVQRGSPLVTNQALNSRSPMPNPPSLPQMNHPNQHPNFSIAQNQYSLAHLRAMPNGQQLPLQMVNGGPHPGGPSPNPQGQQMQPSPDQQVHTTPIISPYTHMYSYPQVSLGYGMQPGRLPPGYPWQMGMGRGIPVNGQHQMSGMAANAAHPQQILNVGKAVSGGMQGR